MIAVLAILAFLLLVPLRTREPLGWEAARKLNEYRGLL